MIPSRVTRVVLFLSLLGFYISCGKDNKEQMLFPDSPSIDKYTFKDIEKIFGFDGENRYSYAPSILKSENGTTHLYFCGTQEGVMVDNIYHIKINPDGTQTAPKVVLSPGIGGEWDDHHVCDPSVVEGNFKMKGINYKYAMFFLGNRYGVYYNEIGVAFSNELGSNHWIKHTQPIVKKSWNYDGNQQNGAYKSWGVGQPSAVSLDRNSRLLLTYTVGDDNGTRIAWAEVDFAVMDNYLPVTPTTMVSDGLSNMTYSSTDIMTNADFAIDWENNNILIVRPVHPNPDQTYPTKIEYAVETAVMPLDDFLASKGKWSQMIRITPTVSGYPRNHNPGIERNSFGAIDEWANPAIYYTTSLAAPDVMPEDGHFAEWTYHIWKGKVHKSTE